MPRPDFRFFHPLRVRYSEVDAQGIVYNAHYLTYCDIALTEYMRRMGIVFSLETARESGEDVHLVKATLEWKSPARLDQELDLWTRTARLGRSSLTFVVEICPRDSDHLLARGEIVWVNTHQATRKSVPLPADWVARIRAFEGDHIEGI